MDYSCSQDKKIEVSLANIGMNYGMEGKLFRISTMCVLHGRDVEKSDSWLMAANRYEALVLLQDLFIPLKN